MRASFIRLAERSDIAPALKKLWKKHHPIDGQVIQTLSPFEQKIVTPMFKDAYSKFYTKAFEFARDAGPALLFFSGLYYWAEWEHKQIAFHHRD
jgi:Cytochrome b-c1 complex subunit 8